MDKNKQTAVEWLRQSINKKLNNELSPYFVDLFDNAKAIEKQQIIDANDMGYSASRRDTDETAEQYYTSTYGQ